MENIGDISADNSVQKNSQTNNHFINEDNAIISDKKEENEFDTAGSSEIIQNQTNSLIEDMDIDALSKNITNVIPTMEIPNDENKIQINGTNDLEEAPSIRKFRTIIDSDSDDDNEFAMTLNKSKSGVTDSHVNQLNKKSKLKSTRLRIDSDSDGDIEETNDNNINDNQSENDREVVIKTKSKNLNDLIDSESEDENDYRNENNLSSKESNKHSVFARDIEKKSEKVKPEKKRTGTKRAAKDEAMRQIHSETQRLLREAPISLPYHRPKQRSLQEFLNRKKTPVIPQGCTVAAKLKMCTAIVNEVVKEKEKEAELFYKSSDSEEDEISISVQSNNTNISSSVPSIITSEDTSIEETQKFHKIDIQNAQNKKQINQQDTLKLGVTRKLFFDDNDPIAIQTHDTSSIISQQLDDDEKKIREKDGKQDLIEVTMPRKLFDDNIDEFTGESLEQCNDSLSNSGIPNDDNTEKNQVHEEIVQLSVKNNTENSDTIETNSNVDGVSSIVEISSTKSIENSPELSQVLLKEKIIDLTDTQSTLTSNISNFSNENCTISETSLISNKEIKNLNNGSLIPSKSSSSEIYNDDASQSSKQYCGVEGLPPPSFDNDDGSVVKLPSTVFKSDEEKIEQSEITPITKKNNTLMNIPNLKPKLRGSPGTFIDFTQTSKPNKKAVNNLVDRFISKHAVINKNVESNSEVTVIQTDKTADGIRIYKDVLPYKLPAVDESIDDSDLNKPGAKLMRLKEELKKKMASKRSEEWKQRAQESMLNDEEEVEELEPEEKEETSLMDSDVSGAEESEPEENDVLITDKKKKICAFGDEEAEVDEDEEMELSDDEEEGDEEEESTEEKYDNDGSEDEEVEKENVQENLKKFNRIVVVNEDSNSGEESLSNNPTISTTFERKRTDIDMFIDDEEESSALQQNSQESQSNIIFKTPITPTNPQNFLESHSSKRNSLHSNSLCIDFNSKLNNLKSQSNDGQLQNYCERVNNKLFNTQDRNVTDEELMALCSGRFTDTNDNSQNINRPRLTGLIPSISSEKPITESQIVDVCSGTFSSSPLLSYTDLSGNVDETSQDIKLTFDDSSQNGNDNILKTKERELDAVNSKIQSTIQTYLDIASSSDEESKISDNIHAENKKIVLKKKKKVKQLILSDDEDETVNRENIEEDEEEEEEEEEEESIVSDEDEEKFIDYDSEENEVAVVNKKELKNVAKTFVDDEAELSESDWGSEDEDEKGLDKLELEEGDVEEIDEDQMRDQLGKLHARQVLDDDQRDVRMLKEMLFDDGDLHTDDVGRERKFKWRNIDKLGDENLLTPTIDEDDENQLDPIELANDIEWRKLRLEREKFLEERMKSNSNLLDSDIDIESGGEFLKLGIKVLKKCKTNLEYKIKTVEKTKSIIPRTVSELVDTPDNKNRVLYSAMKRGSFLARGDEALARLAVMIKKSDTVDLGPKHSKNFLFTNISPSVNDDEDEDDDEDEGESEKREDEQNKLKPMRKRKTTGGTPRTTKKPKMNVNQSSRKKLF